LRAEIAVLKLSTLSRGRAKCPWVARIKRSKAMSHRNTLVVDGHKAVISYDPDINMFRGEFVGLNGGADFVSENVTGLTGEGEASLREFMAVCRKRGIETSRQCPGRCG